jgi:hypothetical protein
MGKDLVQEYLYLDKDRLSTYVDQLRPPVTYDKIPVWSAELAISGPAAKAQQSQDVERARNVLTMLKLEPVEIESKLDEIRRSCEQRLKNRHRMPRGYR